MRSTMVLLSLALLASPGGGGDPIPDVDVILEQVPGAGLTVESVAGGFDRLELGGVKAFIESLAPEKLPAGWTLTRDRRSVVLVAAPGVATNRPVRFRLAAGTRPRSVDWEVSRGGRAVAKGKGLVPRVEPRAEVANSLQGLVYLPADVRAGETLTFRPVGDALPQGTFTLRGEVVDELDEDEWTAALATVNTTRSHLKSGIAVPPREGLVLTSEAGVDCSDLAPLAAALTAEGAGTAAYRVAAVAAPPPSSHRFSVVDLRSLPTTASSAMAAAVKAKHDTAKAVIQNIRAQAAPRQKSDGRGGPGGKPDPAPRGAERAFFAVESGDPAAGDVARISIKEPGIEDQPTSSPPRSAASIRGEGGYDLLTPGGARRHVALRSAKPGELDLSTELPRGTRLVALRVETTDEGCRFTAREPSELEWVRLALHRGVPPGRSESPSGPSGTPGRLEGTVYVAEVPEDLEPGEALAIRFIDRFGDVLVDVPKAPVGVLPPRDAPAPAPCIESATAYVQAADAVCVCGVFPTTAAGWALRLDELPLAAGSVRTTSESVVWLTLPAGTRPGRHVLSGAPEAGFTPSCRAITQRLEIRGAIDSSRLLRGDSTPLRLTIEGTADKVPLRLRNLTPQIISIEGGDDQTASSTGGDINALERQVHGRERGSFNLEWTLAAPACPCAEKR